MIARLGKVVNHAYKVNNDNLSELKWMQTPNSRSCLEAYVQEKCRSSKYVFCYCIWWLLRVLLNSVDPQASTEQLIIPNLLFSYCSNFSFYWIIITRSNISLIGSSLSALELKAQLLPPTTIPSPRPQPLQSFSPISNPNSTQTPNSAQISSPNPKSGKSWKAKGQPRPDLLLPQVVSPSL